MKKKTEKHIQRLGGVLFILYMAALIYFLFFADDYGRNPAQEMRYNLVPFTEIRRFLMHRDVLGTRAVLLNLGGNILGFVPFGAIVPVMHRKLRSFVKVAALGLFFSAGVEIIQLVTRRGSCDVDDVILNTAGAMIGYGIFAGVNGLRKKAARAGAGYEG